MKLDSNIRMDINLATEVWQEMLNTQLPDDIEYIFTKGSSIKSWDSELDYVPVLSDVDIHIKVNDKRKKILNSEDSFEQASFFTTNYSKKFNELCKEKNHTSQHLPRVQIVQLDLEKKRGYVVPPRECDITWIQGKAALPDEMDHDQVRKMDLFNLQSEASFVKAIPSTYMGLSGLEYYPLLYRISSRISPSPIRLLTQVMNENPHDIWAYNKTTVKKKLLEYKFQEIAEYYEIYYILGWELFESNFTDIKIFQDMIKTGYYFLKGCLDEVKKFQKE